MFQRAGELAFTAQQQTIDKHFLEVMQRAWLRGPEITPQVVILFVLLVLVILVLSGMLLWRMEPVRDWVGRVLSLQRRTLYHMLQNEKFVLDHLRVSGQIVDMALVKGMRPLVAARCAVVGTLGKITCEAVQEVDLDGLRPGERVLLVFPPLMVGKRRVNAVRTAYKGMETRGRTVYILLGKPEKYFFLSRRAHPRKRVRYQELVQVKIWKAGRTTKANFHETPPDLAVNLEMDADGREVKGRVVNVSKGGLAVLVPEDETAKGFGEGVGVVVNLFLFNMSEEQFRAYWYAGKVASATPDGAGNVRLGIQFTHSAQTPEKDRHEMMWVSLDN